LRVSYYDSSATEKFTDVLLADTSTTFKGKSGVFVDSTLSGGTLVRVYINDECKSTVYIENANNVHDATDNTSVVLFWQNTVVTLEYITLKTYTAPIAA
jgi:hypothetical protein